VYKKNYRVQGGGDWSKEKVNKGIRKNPNQIPKVGTMQIKTSKNNQTNFKKRD